MAGLIFWHELFTDDVEAAKGFYTDLLGAEIETADMGDFQYQMLKKDGRTARRLRRQARRRREAPSHWYPYIHVDDVDAATENAKGLGRAGRTWGRWTIDENLRFAVLGDPQRDSFGLMSWNQEPQTGLFAWDELHAADVDAAASVLRRARRLDEGAVHGGLRGFNAGETASPG